MSTQPMHISATIPAALAALESPKSLEQLCADVDRTNPNALEHWTGRLYWMRRYPGADEAIRCFLYEVASRPSDLQARSKSYTNQIARPGAWLNTQTRKWIERRAAAVEPQRRTTP